MSTESLMVTLDDIGLIPITISKTADCNSLRHFQPRTAFANQSTHSLLGPVTGRDVASGLPKVG
ncbi:hypothetical protein PG985_016161 [Apiospora marii]|uniref:uncharacterized protein n=1 Tax=Apiospora marii TaxID=335849 RepID=UPI003130BC62